MSLMKKFRFARFAALLHPFFHPFFISRVLGLMFSRLYNSYVNVIAISVPHQPVEDSLITAWFQIDEEFILMNEIFTYGTRNSFSYILGNQNNYFFMFDFEKNPMSSEVDYFLSISCDSLEIIYHEVCILLLYYCRE